MHIRYFLFLIMIFMQSSVWPKDRDAWVGEDYQGRPCRGTEIPYGPYDYTNNEDRSHKLAIVEKFHFQPMDEQLKAPNTLGGIEYTLLAFPNHHRALNALIRFYVQKYKSSKPGTTMYDIAISNRRLSPPECFLQRAMHFSPNDGTVYSLMGLFTHRIKMYKKAEEAYRKAIKLLPESSDTHYAFGLLLTDLERFDEALIEAQIAYKLGYPLPGLKRRLQAAGYNL